MQWEGTGLHREAATSRHCKDELLIIFAFMHSRHLHYPSVWPQARMWLLFKKQTNTRKNSVRKRNIGERHLEYKYDLAGLLNVKFEILGTFIILMEIFCTDINELFRMSQEVIKQSSWETPDTVAKMVSNS